MDANNLARHSNIVALFQGEPEVHVNRSLFLVLWSRPIIDQAVEKRNNKWILQIEFAIRNQSVGV